jgi:LCP family protein required for cell wall assembly
MILCGVGSIFILNLAQQAARGFDTEKLIARKERINVLLLGVDQRVGMTDPARTDTMLVLTVDPQSKTAGLLSINRDLWVKIAGLNQEGKINTAHFLGEVERVPGGGPALAMQTVQNTFGLPIPYYLRLNFTAFEKLIDQIGGIDVYVAEAIDDPDYPDAGFGYEPFSIDAGWQHLDGRTALKYARTRATPGSDLDRVKRQQQVILAVRDKVLNDNRLPELLAQSGWLLQTLGDSVQTNLTPGQLNELAQLAAQIKRDEIQSVTLDSRLIEEYFTPDGQDAIVLKPGAVQQIRAQLYALPVTPGTPPTTTPMSSPLQPTVPQLMTITPLPRITATSSGPRIHIVQEGDTLFSLARRYSVTVEIISQANQLSGDNISVGQQLIIPQP